MRLFLTLIIFFGEVFKRLLGKKLHFLLETAAVYVCLKDLGCSFVLCLVSVLLRILVHIFVVFYLFCVDAKDFFQAVVQLG